MNINSLSNEVITNQMKNDDDQSTVKHDITKAGTYSQLVYLSADNLLGLLPTQQTIGDAYGYVGQDIYVTSKLILGQINESDVNAVNNLVKFDGNCVEPRLDPNGKNILKEILMEVWNLMLCI